MMQTALPMRRDHAAAQRPAASARTRIAVGGAR